METIIETMTKWKYFIAGILAGGVLHLFELQIAKMKFNFFRFLVSSVIFALLTEFSKMVIFWWYLDIASNDNKAMVMSIAIAAFLYLFIPFVMKEENRWQFIISVLSKFGFEKK